MIGVGVGEAQAGAFGLREQSTAGLGAAFAGVAAGAGGLGTMFWNPATLTQSPGIQFEMDASVIIPYAQITAGQGSSAGYLPPLTGRLQAQGDSGDIGNDAVLPATYASYQFNDKIWFGLSINTPYGLTTKPDQAWAGRVYGSTTQVLSFDGAPTIAYKINDWVSVGAGLRVMYFKARYTSAAPTLAPVSQWNTLGLQGDSFGVGYTLGVTFTPLAGTQIGIGFRSAVSQTLEGDYEGAAAAVGPANAARFNNPVEAHVVLPEMITIGLKQVITEQFTAMLGFEWTNWSRIGFPRVVDQTTGELHGLTPALTLDYRDGWFASVGGEYKINAAWTGRAGLAYESSPITTQTRSTRLPDNNRIWATLGASYNWNEKLSFDVSYAHIFPQDTKIAMVDGNPSYNSRLGIFRNLVGGSDGHVDIISVGIKYRWDDPSKTEPVIRKY
jgi:long-chain fatty acid transport protein